MRHIRTAIVVLTATSLFAQTSTGPAKPAAPAQKPAAAAAPAGPKAIIETSMGTITCTLFEKEAPKTVANFIGLAEGTKEWKHPMTRATKRNTPLYNGTVFHRVIPNFMIQGGDPMGNGTGDPGYSFEDEFVPTLKFDRPGRLAMANSGPNTNGSQFFITEVPTPHLDACWDEGGCTRLGRRVEKGRYGHTIFGQCGPESLVGQIARVPHDPRNNKPFQSVKVVKVTIRRPGQAAPAGAAKPATAPKKPAAKPASGSAAKPRTQ